MTAGPPMIEVCVLSVPAMILHFNALSRSGHASTDRKPFARSVKVLIFFKRILSSQRCVPVREVPKAFDQMKMGGGKFLIPIDNLGKQFDGVLLNFQAIAMLVWQIKEYLLCLSEFFGPSPFRSQYQRSPMP
jgi:hypothetical protein